MHASHSTIDYLNMTSSDDGSELSQAPINHRVRVTLTLHAIVGNLNEEGAMEALKAENQQSKPLVSG